jgi:hypothetical protein
MAETVIVYGNPSFESGSPSGTLSTIALSQRPSQEANKNGESQKSLARQGEREWD